MGPVARRMLVALALCMAASEASAQAWRSYVNDRFGASVEYPELFSVLDEPPANSDGQRFHTADRTATLAVFGFFNVLDETPKQMMESRRKPGFQYVYADAKPHAFALSGRKAARITYVRCLRSRRERSIFVCAELDYPAAEAARYDPIVKRVSASLKAGKPS